MRPVIFGGEKRWASNYEEITVELSLRIRSISVSRKSIDFVPVISLRNSKAFYHVECISFQSHVYLIDAGGICCSYW